MAKQRNAIAGAFIARPRQLLDSPVLWVLSLSAHRALIRIELEHMAHAGSANGKLPVTYKDLERCGIHPDAVAPALRELEALGIIETTRRGYGGAAEVRVPSLYRLTYVRAWNAGRADGAGTHEYLRFKTREEAEKAAQEARKAADPRNSARSKNYFATPGIRSFSTPENGGETQNSRPRKAGVLRPPPENGGTIYILEGIPYPHNDHPEPHSPDAEAAREHGRLTPPPAPARDGLRPSSAPERTRRAEGARR